MSSNVNKRTNNDPFLNVDANAASSYVFDDYENVLISLKWTKEHTTKYDYLKNILQY